MEEQEERAQALGEGDELPRHADRDEEESHSLRWPKMLGESSPELLFLLGMAPNPPEEIKLFLWYHLLHSLGVLNDDEYRRKKKQLLVPLPMESRGEKSDVPKPETPPDKANGGGAKGSTSTSPEGRANS